MSRKDIEAKIENVSGVKSAEHNLSSSENCMTIKMSSLQRVGSNLTEKLLEENYAIVEIDTTEDWVFAEEFYEAEKTITKTVNQFK